MTPEEIKSEARACMQVLLDSIHPNLRKNLTPLQLNEKFKKERKVPLDFGYKHLLWMCEKVEWMVDEGHLDRAIRWLGFVQGVLWFSEKTSVDEMQGWELPRGE